MKLSFYVFEQSLQYLSEFFNKSEVIVIHIPLSLSLYKLVLPKGPLLLQKILSREGKYETRLKKIKNVGNTTCIEIERITKKQNIKFLDITHAFFNGDSIQLGCYSS